MSSESGYKQFLISFLGFALQVMPVRYGQDVRQFLEDCHERTGEYAIVWCVRCLSTKMVSSLLALLSRKSNWR